MQYKYKTIIMSTIICLKICKYTIKEQWEGIHWSINQTPHFPQLEFKFDPLNILNGVAILWTYIFHLRPHLTARLTFHLFFENLIVLKKTWSRQLFLFLFFLRENKIRKKIISVTPYLEKIVCGKPKSGSSGKLPIWKLR